ncbi:MerR family transcriptional regulator [Actinacidiphila sp. ITFR-21]|uniref:MerR family transcriptional regulator n=1 Tax=Actinacidiphila sp. ITFR-21 TaxID=3075199 RepID=UPI00288B7363|nr:MerR family transcriptional regulator [Streptomyces sp. ITFR-21]WNI18907.1 MerR family transcriptional regulator [Streptomyces sp. ITFR-21]
MRISELSRLSGVSVATIKYYIREGLLPVGRPTGVKQAEYDEDHVRRLRLVRALISVRGLSVHTTAEILRAIADSDANIHRTLGLVLGALDAGAREQRGMPPPKEGEVDRLIEEMGWRVHASSTAPRTLGDALTSLQQLGVDLDWQTLLPYARLAEQIAEVDLGQLGDSDEPLELAERAVLMTVLLEPALMALRRMAQEHLSAAKHRL